MTLFLLIFLKILPLYVNVILGFIASKYLHVSRESVAALLIYILGPIVVFSATVSVKINITLFALPIFLYLLCSLLAFMALFLWEKSWNNPTGNILAFSAGTGNTGYFGIPLAIIFFEPALADIYIFVVLASLLYESSTGFYVTAKGNFTVKESLQKVARMPIIYAFIFGIVCNLLGFEIPEVIDVYTAQFKGAYGILGMMMLGMGLIGLRSNTDNFDKKFISIAFILKFVFWPLAILALIELDRSVFQWLDEDLYKVLFLFSIVPLAGNTVTLAVLLNAKPEKASLAVFLSTLISVISIPVYIYWYGGF